MIAAALKDDALLTDVHTTPVGDGFALWWLGQSGFLLKHGGGYLAFDPYLSDSLTHKYAATDKPHVRMSERVIDPARLDFVNAVTSSHNHTDHLDADTLQPMMAANPNLSLVIGEANRAFVTERLGCAPDWPIGLTDGEHVDAAGVRIHAVPAAHEALDRNEQGRPRHLGYVVQCGRWCIYHSGDTVWFDGLESHLRAFRIDLALLPINGRAPERRVAGNLWGDEAADLARRIGARMVVPCHYHMFAFNSETPDLFMRRCLEIAQPFTILRSGERLTSTAIERAHTGHEPQA